MISNKIRMLLLPLLFNIELQVLARAIRKKMRKYLDYNEKNAKLYLFAHDMIFYIGILRIPQKTSINPAIIQF